jgi:hypothetical protein
MRIDAHPQGTQPHPRDACPVSVLLLNGLEILNKDEEIATDDFLAD